MHGSHGLREAWDDAFILPPDHGFSLMNASVPLRASQRGPPGYALRADLNVFLQAPVYEERHGMALTVLSALARLGVDPWEQAAALARLPSAAAARELGSLLSALPDWTAPGSDKTMITARLVALLPDSPGRTSGAHESIEPAQPVARAPNYLWIYAIVMLLLLSVQWLNARNHADPPAAIPQAAAQSSAQPLPPAVPAN